MEWSARTSKHFSWTWALGSKAFAAGIHPTGPGSDGLWLCKVGSAYGAPMAQHQMRPYEAPPGRSCFFPHIFVCGVLVFDAVSRSSSSSAASSSDLLRLLLSHTTLSHSLSHTTLSHTTCSHIALSHTTLSHTLFHTLWHTNLSHTTCSHTDTTLSHTLFHTQLFHTQFFHSTFVLRGRRGACLYQPSFCVAGVALMTLGWPWWRAWAPLVARARHFAWQAWHLVTSTFPLLGTWGHARCEWVHLSQIRLCHRQFCHTQSFTHTHTSLSHATSLSHPSLSHTTLSNTIFHTQLCHTQLCTYNFSNYRSSTISFVLSAVSVRFNHFFWLLEEVDLWGYPVLHFFYPL